MRISDWSSDVCSSDLPGDASQVTPWVLGKPSASDRQKIDAAIELALGHPDAILAGKFQQVMNSLNGAKNDRSEERRVGKECVGTGRSRGSQYHSNKNKTIKNIPVVEYT